jgi:hypothetical protein
MKLSGFEHQMCQSTASSLPAISLVYKPITWSSEEDDVVSCNKVEWMIIKQAERRMQ